MGLHWVDPEDWLVDTWADSALLLTGEVPARVAHLFTDGAQPFPLQALRAAWPDFEVQDDPRSCAQLADEPRDQHWGRAAFERHDAAPDGRVTVTWRASLAERVGDWRVEALAQLQAHTRGERVRLFLYWA
jgi:hypothetical protein